MSEFPTPYGGCGCNCHSWEAKVHVMHMVPCCYPSDDEAPFVSEANEIVVSDATRKQMSLDRLARPEVQRRLKQMKDDT